MGVADAEFTAHAREQMERRGITEQEVRRVLLVPTIVEQVRPGRLVLQRRLASGTPPREYLVRVIVDVDRTPPEIVTAYRTTRLAKYERARWT